MGRRLFDLVHPDDLASTMASFRDLLEGRRDPSFCSELRFHHKDGSWRVLEVKARPFADVGGKACYVFNSRDVTERKQMEDMLRFIRLSVDRAAELIHWMDGDGRILFVNEALCVRTGYSQDEMLGMTVFDLAPNLSRELWREQWSELQRTGSLVAESLHRTKSGELFPVEVLASWVEAREGREYSFAYARDITERVRVDAELRTSQAQLEARWIWPTWSIGNSTRRRASSRSTTGSTPCTAQPRKPRVATRCRATCTPTSSSTPMTSTWSIRKWRRPERTDPNYRA